MATPLDIKAFLTSDAPILDVRSEAEFAAGHIPNAISLPLFNNAERAEIGTLYKHAGRQAAILRGLEFVGTRMQYLATSGLALARNNKIAVHCWRGGMRSSSVGWLMTHVGLDVVTLTGGYKSYRRLCAELFASPWQLRVIGGKTGSQKTRLLGELRAKGAAIIDLEELAKHRGSAFGYASDGLQPTQEQFENQLGLDLWQSNNLKPLFIEDESLMIGRLQVPTPLWKQMRSAPVTVIEWPIEKRIDFLMREYQAPTEKIQENLKSIRKRLGLERYANALAALAEGRLDEVCRIVLDYYDRTYTYGLSLRNQSQLKYLPGDAALQEILQDTSWNTD